MNLFAYTRKSVRHHLGLGVLVIVSLAVALFSAVLGIMVSIQQSIYQQSISRSGNYHVGYTCLSQEQVTQILEDDRVAWGDLRLVLREYGKIPGTEDAIHLFSSSGFSHVEGFYLEWGKMPQEENEVVLFPRTAKALGLKGTPGERFTLETKVPWGEQHSYEMILTGLVGEKMTADVYFGHQAYVSQAFALARGQFPQTYQEATALDDTGDARMVYLQFKAGLDPKEAATALAAEVGITEKEDTRINEEYLRVSLNDPGLIPITVAALGVLLLTGVLMMHSAFGIVVVKRSRQLGLLRLVGATKGQLTACVLLEGLFSFLVALPVGLVLGAGLVWLGIPVCGVILANQVAVTFSMPLWIFGLTAVLALVMVVLGALLPARRAGKITPVEAVQFTVPQEKQGKRKAVEELNLPRLAALNLKRSQSRTRGILLALSLSGILFLTICSVAFSMLDGVDVQVRATAPGDISVESGKQAGTRYQMADTYQLTASLVEQLRGLEGVTQVDSFLSQFYRPAASAQAEESLDLTFQIGSVVGVSPQVLERVLETIPNAPPVEAFRAPGAALVLNGNGKEGAPYHITQLGSTEAFQPMKDLGTPGEGPDFTLEVLAVGESKALPLPRRFGGGLPTFLLLEEVYLESGLAQDMIGASLWITEEHHDTILEEVHEILSPYDQLYTESAILKKQEMRNQLIGTLVLVFLIVFLVAVLGLLNLASATCIGIQQRQREFGVLYALGLGKKGIRRLLYRESLVISLKSMALSSAVGLGLGIGLTVLLRVVAGADYLRFSFPLFPLLGLALVYLLAPLLTTFAASRPLLNQTPVELLGEE